MIYIYLFNTCNLCVILWMLQIWSCAVDGKTTPSETVDSSCFHINVIVDAACDYYCTPDVMVWCLINNTLFLHWYEGYQLLNVPIHQTIRDVIITIISITLHAIQSLLMFGTGSNKQIIYILCTMVIYYCLQNSNFPQQQNGLFIYSEYYWVDYYYYYKILQ